MPVYLGFIANRANGDEFVAPVEAADREAARLRLGHDYPAPAFALLTVYSRAEMDHVLAGIDRWHQAPRPAPDPLAHVSVSLGALPPLPR